MPKKELKGKLYKKVTLHKAKIIGWHAEKADILYKDSVEICEYKGGKLYAALGDGFKDKTWERSLEKGLAKGAVGFNGVKLLYSILELKIKGDERLYTSTLYKNSNGDFLAIFDKEARHKEIARIVRDKGEMEIMECSDYSEESIFEADYLGGYGCASEFEY